MQTTIEREQELSLKNPCVEFMFAYQQRNVDKMLSFCNSDGNVHFGPLGESGNGKIYELGRGIWSALIDSFPDIDNTLDAAVATGEQEVRCQVVIRGTQQKDFADIPSRGLHFDSDHIFIFHVNPSNKIDDIRISWDHTDLKKQLSKVAK